MINKEVKESISNIDENINQKNTENTNHPIYCPNCGVKLSKDSKFCQNCGYNLIKFDNNIKICPKCGFKLESDSTQCPNCGKTFKN